jgi:hypothetical protein
MIGQIVFWVLLGVFLSILAIRYSRGGPKP